MNWLEILGYVASVLVAVSLMMTSILRLRLLNLVGSLTFALYGYLIGAYPVAAVNFFIACINIFYIVRMLRTREYFTIVNVLPDSDYVKYFIAQNLEDIRKTAPGFEYEPKPEQLTLFVVRDLQPAGLLIGEPRGDGMLYVVLDYVIPGYRDLKVGSYLLNERQDYFRERGIHTLIARGGPRVHARYLETMGFAKKEADLYQRQVG